MGYIHRRRSKIINKNTIELELKGSDLNGVFIWSEWGDLNPRPLGPEPSALPTALHPGKKNRSSQAAAVWLGMRESNSHGRSQSPLHYHYANPHRILCLGRLPSTLIYYSVPRRICQRFFQKNFKIFKKSLSALHSLFLCFHGHLPANGLYCFP